MNWVDFSLSNRASFAVEWSGEPDEIRCGHPIDSH